MGNTSISWCDFTFNPVIGCTKVSAACDHCYAAEYAKRYEPLVRWGEPGQKVVYRRTAEANWRKPLAWNRAAKAPQFGERRPRVFCASLADVFDNGWDPQWRADLWDLIGATPALDWLLLTKRPQNIKKMIPEDWWPLPNVWLGCTTENQDEYWKRRAHLFAVPAAVHFISYEPALGGLSIQGPVVPDWVICGGESGTQRRPFDMRWAEDLQTECETLGVAFHFKQDAALHPGQRGRASDKLWNCKQFPEVPV